jgi:hypothetical protein
MKITRAIPIVFYGIALLIIGDLIYRWAFASGGGRSSGFGYGNLWIQLSVENRGVLSPRIPWLIATPEMPTSQSYRGDDDQWTFIYANGKIFTLRPDPRNLVWIDPTSGPTAVPAELTVELVQRIEQTRERAQGLTFGSGVEFLTWLAKTNAEHDSAGQPATRPVDELEGGLKSQPAAEGRPR